MADDKDTRIVEVRLAECLEGGYGLTIGDFLCNDEETKAVINALRLVANVKLEVLAEQELANPKEKTEPPSVH
jgi:hypothetical protein